MPGHFAKCAQIVNVWRSWGNAAKIKELWTALYGKDRADIVCSSLPPRPLKGRWGTVEEIEKRLLVCGSIELATVFEEPWLALSVFYSFGF